MKETAVATSLANKEKQGDCPFESSHISTKLCVHFSTFDQFPDRFSIGAKSGIFQLDFTHFLFSCFSFEDFCGFCYVWDFPVVCAHNAKASRVTICKRFIYKERRKMHQTRSHFIQLSAVAVKRRNTNRKRYMWQWHIYSFFTSFSQRFCRVGMMLSHWKKKCLLPWRAELGRGDFYRRRKDSWAKLDSPQGGLCSWW